MVVAAPTPYQVLRELNWIAYMSNIGTKLDLFKAVAAVIYPSEFEFITRPPLTMTLPVSVPTYSMVWSYQFEDTRPRLVCPRVKVGAHYVQLKIHVHLSSTLGPEAAKIVITVLSADVAATAVFSTSY